MRNTLTLTVVALLTIVGCNNTNSPVAPPLPPTSDAAVAIGSSGGDSLSVMGAASPIVQGCSAKTSWKNAHWQASQKYWKVAFHTGASTYTSEDDVYWYKRAKGCKGHSQLEHDCQTATLVCFGEWNTKTKTKSGYSLTINFKPSACGSNNLTCEDR